MLKTTLNFFGEEVIIDTPNDLTSLRAKICEKYLFSSSDVSEIILYYIKENKKIYIINGNDFLIFKESKIPTIFLDINQNSKLYLDNASEMKKENQKNQKELEELNHKLKEFSQKKKKVQHIFEDELKHIELKIMEMNKKKREIMNKKEIALIKMMKEKEMIETKMYYLQKKLSLPITAPVPKEEKPKIVSLKNNPPKQPLFLSFRNNTRFAPLKDKEIQKRIEIEKLRAIASAKAFALQKPKIEIKNNKENEIKKNKEIKKKIIDSKLKSVAKAKKAALNVAKREHDEIINKQSEIQKRIEIIKSKSIAKAKEQALIVGLRAKEADIINQNEKEQNSPINTVSVFKKVNEVLGNAVDKVKEVAKKVIIKQKEEPKKEEIKDEKEKLKKEEEEKKLKEKEKKEQIDKIMKITRETINEINNLTKMVITQSNLFIEQINNPENKLNLSSDDIILKSVPKEIKKRDVIHVGIICDGCKKKPIRGNRYKCKGCKDFDFCESCYQKNKESHGHEFKKIEKPGNTKRPGHKNTKFCQRGIVHRDIRCERCGLEPLVGYRFMCTICDDYNLCENCEEESGKRHNHPFIKVSYPSILKPFNNAYLKLNYYDPQ